MTEPNAKAILEPIIAGYSLLGTGETDNGDELLDKGTGEMMETMFPKYATQSCYQFWKRYCQ